MKPLTKLREMFRYLFKKPPPGPTTDSRNPDNPDNFVIGEPALDEESWEKIFEEYPDIRDKF